MDGQRFDDLTKALRSVGSRRRVLMGIGGLAGGALLLRGVEAAVAKPGKGKGRGQTKVGICHQSDDGTYRFIRVGAPAAAAHERNHEGDVVCPTATEDPCNVYSSCDPTTGACLPTPANEGGACVVDPTTGAAGTCTAGACVPTTPTP